MSSKNTSTESGAPRWTYAAAAIVAIAGLVWAIASFFLTERTTSSRVTPTPTASPSVNVSAPGSVGVGTMSGGSITVGTPQKLDNAASPHASK